MLKASVIVSVYNKADIFMLTLTALCQQTFKDFEIIIADDGSAKEIKDTAEKICSGFGIKMTHVWQEDSGFRKNRILNKAVLASETDYIIFLDGDCIPISNFVKQHCIHHSSNTVLCGSRVNLSERISQKINLEMIHEMRHEKIMRSLILDSLRAKGTRTTHAEEGLYIKSEFINKLINKRKRLIGCNFSLPKELLMKINGFDENYTGAGIGEDSDIEFRLKLAGAELKSVRNRAIVYHMYHPKTKENPVNLEYFEKVKAAGEFICRNGINKY